MSQEFEREVIKRFDKMEQKIDNVNVELSQKIDDVNVELNQKIDNVNVELSQKIDNVNVELSQKIDDVKKELTERIDVLSGNVTLLEYKVTTELPAIYEAHTVNYQIQKENERKLEAVLETTSKNSIHITHLYETVKDHEKKLNKLIS